MILIIKGTKADALAALAAHGIKTKVELLAQTSVTDSIAGTYTRVVDVDKLYEHHIQDWFCESGEPPFAAGTLLLYSETELGELS
jgi:hypothetical protein